MAFLSFLIPAVVVLFVGLVFYRVFGEVFKQMKNRKRLAQEGSLAMADVISISQSGTTVNQVPEMHLTLAVDNPGGRPRKIEIRQLVDIGSMPRPGDRVYVLVDPNDPNNVVLSPVPSGSGVAINVLDEAGHPAGTMDMGSPEVKDYISMPPALRERGQPGVAKVVSVEPADAAESKVTLDLDFIGQPGRRVTIFRRIDGFAPAPGTRLYYIYDPQDPDLLVLAPASMTQGQTLGVGTNRLDPLVLGPQLLQYGAKASGKVLSVQAAAMASSVLAAQGFSKWVLQLDVIPQDPAVQPYQAELTISLTSKEKADRIAREGAEVPLRYDPLDLNTISIDSPAMGYPDPYETTLNIFKEQLARH